MTKHYPLDLTVPPNTPEDSPVSAELTVEGAMLSRLHVLIPPGHCGLARLAVYYGQAQIFPAERGTWLKGDNQYLRLDLNWPLPESRCTLTFKGWNEDDTNPHTFYMLAEVAETVEEVQMWKVLSDFLAVLKALIGIV